MINIFRGNFIDAMNIRNLLESNNIEVFVQNEYMSSIQPWTVTSGGFNPVTLIIKEEELERAGKIIADFQNGNLSLEAE